MAQSAVRGAKPILRPTTKLQNFADALRRLAGRPASGRHVTRRQLFDLANEHDPVPQRPVRERPIRASRPVPEPEVAAPVVPAVAAVLRPPHVPAAAAVLTPPPEQQPEPQYPRQGSDAVADYLRRQPKNQRGRYGSDAF